MRFFSNEAQDNVDDKTDRPTDPDTTAPVPQQRAGSPWQHDSDPAPQPTAVGTSSVGDTDTVRPDDDPDRTGRLPDTTDRTVAFGDDVTRDPGVDGEPAPRHSLPDDTTPQHKLPDDDGYEPVKDTFDKDETDKDETGKDKAFADAFDEDQTDKDGFGKDEPVKDTFDKDETDKDERIEDEQRKDDAVVDAARDGRGEFDEPHVTPAADTEPEPVVATPAETGPVAFFPSSDAQPLRDRWRDVQLRFVDDPKGATAEAAGLVDEAVDKLSQALRDHRGSFAKGSDDTESLRIELRGYRDILDRLLGI
jgi:hypothetical protein